MKLRTIIFAAATLSASFCTSANTLGQQADEAYNKEDYVNAIELYTRSIAQEGVSADVYYNLGNAHYRNNHLGQAVLNYERALRIDPTHDDARTNLQFVRTHIQDRPEDDTAFFASVHRAIVNAATPNAWAWIAFAIFLLFIAAVASYIFAPGIALRKTGFFGGIVLLFLFAYILFVAWSASSRAASHEEAVVITPSTQLTSAPMGGRNATDKVVTIHEGTLVEIIDSVATPEDPSSPIWYNVKINNATKAWLRGSDVERI